MKIPLSSSDWYKSTVPGDGSQIDIKSTSSATASVSPIILSQSDTDVTRTVFEPVLVNNPHDRDKSISGKLIYEKKSKGDEYPTEKITPRIIKTGEIMELSLDTTAVFTLFQTITLLYDMYAKNGIPYGTASYERIDSSFHTFREIIQNDPSAARMIGSTENFELVKILLQLITTTESTESLKNALQNLQNKNMEQLSQSISIERLNRVIALIENNLDNSNEEFWQSEVFKDNQWVLAQLFASPCTIFQDKAYVGGKSIDNHKGNLCDFLYQNQITNNVALIEIKTPKTQIIHNTYRQTFSFSYDMSGAVNQVINYRDSLMKEYRSIRASSMQNFSVFNPKCIVIIGRLSSLEKGQIAAFENYRNSLNNIEIIAYDEILIRLKDLKDIFKLDFSIHAVEEEELPF